MHWYRADPAALDQLLPEGSTDDPHDARWTIHPEGKWILGNHPDATQGEMAQLVDVLQQERAAFAYSMSDLPGYTGALGPAHFELKEDKTMWQPPRQYTEEEYAVGDAKVEEMLIADIIYEVPTTVRHASAVTLPMKRAPDGSWSDKRFAIDLRHINSNSVVDRYGTPLPEELFRRMRGARFFSKFDMRSGFFQVMLDLPSQLQTVFHWRGRCYAFKRLPFGHVNATAVFQRRMEQELQAAGLQHTACVFVDDICIYSDSMADHVAAIRQLLQHMQQVGLRAHPAKTIVAADCLPYLGHLVTATELRPDPAKVAAMVSLQPPDSVKRLQAHIGLFNYYRCYIPYFSEAAQPLYQLLKKDAPFLWGDEQQRAYDKLKEALTVPGLALRQPRRDRPYRLYTDWSSNGIAAVLNQLDENGNEYLVACVSRSLNDAEKQYPAWKGELLAAIHGIRSLRPYLLSCTADQLQLVTDHRALLWMLTQKAPTGQLARWILSVSEYQFTLVHRPGSRNPADLPSREPQACAADWTGSRQDTELPQCLLPRVLLPDGSSDPEQYTAADLEAYVHPPPMSAAAAQLAAAAAQSDIEQQLFRPSQLLAQQAGDTPPSLAAVQHSTLQALMAISAAAVSAGIDQHDPCSESAVSLLSGGTRAHPISFLAAAAMEQTHPARAWSLQQLQPAAAAWVAAACNHPVPAAAIAVAAPPLPGTWSGTPDQHGVRTTLQLSTSSVAATFFPHALQQGLTLYEPCGGMCAGLEMVLRAGVKVQQYLYSDISPEAQHVAQHRMQQLMGEFPQLLQPSGLTGALSTVPADIRQVQHAHLAAAVRQTPAKQWLVVAGWPCQDFSRAGPSQGLAGSRSRLLYDLVRIVGALQQLQPTLPPAYILENVPMQLHHSSSIASADFQHICSIIGQPALVDAAQFGSLAHRLRNYWSNLCSPKQLMGALQWVARPAGRTVQLAVQQHRTARPVYRADQAPFYPCNQAAQPRAAWPTLMAKQASYAFRPQQPGSIYDSSIPSAPRWDEPTAVEREVTLGYLPGSTAAEGLSDRSRCALLGQCIDANALLGIWAISLAWWQHPRASMHTHQHSGGDAAAVGCSRPQPAAVPAFLALLAQQTACAAQEALAAGGESSEVWTDHPTLSTLRSGQPGADLSSKERYRVQQRLKLYRWDPQHQQLIRVLLDGSTRIVPPPEQRQQLIQQQHQQCGHFGIRRTAALLATKYWWHGMLADTAAVVRRCQHCSLVHASFNAKGNREQLQSIPISSAGFRWHVDLAGPFPVSRRGSRYILVAVEAFSKWLEVVPIINKEPDTVAFAFLHNVLARFAAPGQVVSDNGAEWEGEFAQLLADCLIDHANTSPAHPQANGQAEKAVDIVKRALRKMCLQRHKLDDWDTDVAWLSLGYRCSPHSSTGFAPYELMYARKPVAPPAVRAALQSHLDMDDPAAAAVDLLRRKELVQRLCPEALANLSIAQQRDQRRYALVRSKLYQPRVYRFQPGDYVYVKQQQRHSTLQPQARPSILRVRLVLPSGVLQLQGKCGLSWQTRSITSCVRSVPGKSRSRTCCCAISATQAITRSACSRPSTQYPRANGSALSVWRRATQQQMRWPGRSSGNSSSSRQTGLCCSQMQACVGVTTLLLSCMAACC